MAEGLFGGWRFRKEKEAPTKESLPADIFNPEQKRDFEATLHDLSKLYSFMAGIHERNEKYEISSRAHSIDHDLAVAAFAHAIGRKYSKDLAKKSMAAAFVHSYDRFREAPYESVENFKPEDVKQWVEHTLPEMADAERAEIIQAATGHDRPNKGRKTDTPNVGDVLADADKLANLMLYTMVRSGQYLPEKPTLKPGNIDKLTPGANYKRHNVAFDDIHGMGQWLDDKDWFVTKEAVRTAEVLEKPFKRFIATVQRQFAELGIESIPARRI